VKLLLNATSLRPPLTGIGNYTYNLIRQFENSNSIERIDCFNNGHFLSSKAQLAEIVDDKSAVGPLPLVSRVAQRVRSLPGAYRLYSYLNDYRFFRLGAANKDTVYHEPNFILKKYSGPSVVTIHDLSFLHYPQYHPKERVKWLANQLPATLDRADFVITDSDIIRADLLENHGLNENKVKSIYLGASEAYRPRPAIDVMNTLSKYGLEYKKFILFVGTLEPRKGVDVLLDAWELLSLKLQKEYPLVLIGSSGWNNKDLLSRITRLTENKPLLHLKYIPDSELPDFYSAAKVFCFPSVYEGFGLPVLEAMSSGTPVICRAKTSMAEFAKSSCLYCETDTPDELRANIEDVLLNDGASAKLADAGLAAAKSFSWSRCAHETELVYRSVL